MAIEALPGPLAPEAEATLVDRALPESFWTAVLGVPEGEASPVTEIVFIDAAVADSQILAEHARPGVRVALLDASRSALDQIETALQGLSGLEAIHIVSHGAEGVVMLGDLQLSAGGLDPHSEQLARIGSYLSEQGDLLLYGCDIAAGAEGMELIGRLAQRTGADVAASENTTGTALAGGDWVLEASTGAIEGSSFLAESGEEAYGNWLSSRPLNTSSGWTAVAFGTNFDPVGDSQAGAADTDIVGGASHGSLYVMFDDGGTADPADDRMGFRLRIDNPTSDTRFGGVAVVGIDGNNDGRVDLFIAVDGRNNGQVIRLLDPGNGLNNSPSTTSTSVLPSGWLANDGIYAMSASNYSVVPVSSATDPHWNGNADIGGDSNTDVFVSWSVPLKDVAAVLAIPSPADRNGVFGPRGSEGIAGFNKDSLVRYLAFTQTQTGPINGDLNGVGKSYDRNATFESLGVVSEPMSSADPIAAAPGISIDGTIGGDGILNAAEHASVTISGGSSFLPEGTIITLLVSDGSDAITTSAVVDGSGNWSATGLNLSALAEGSLTVTATSDDLSAQASVLHDTAAPSLGIDPLAGDSTGTPTFLGSSDLPDGSLITVTIDHDNDLGTALLVYEVLLSGGLWTLDTASTPPVSGSMPSGGLSASAKVSASAQDAAGNAVVALALNRPTIDALTTSSATPALSGRWTFVAGDSLVVSVGGATYDVAPAGDRWSLDLATAVPVSGTLSLASGSSYEVLATVSREGASLSDVSASELTITNDPPVSIGIDGGESVSLADPTPVITGSSANAGGFVIVRLDPGNEGDLSDAVTYSVVPDGLGDWALDLSSAAPISGTAPAAGFLGSVGVYATDSTGVTAASQTLQIAIPTLTVSSVVSTASSDAFGLVENSGGGEAWLNMTEDNAVSISGAASDGFLVDLVVSDANGNSIEVAGVTVSGGLWTASGLDLSSLDSTQLTVTASLQGTQISASDQSVTHDALTPRIFITNPSEIKKNGGVIYGVSELPNTSLTVTVSDSTDTSTVGTWATTTDGSGNWTVTTSGNLVSGASGTVIIRVAPTTSPATDVAGNVTQVAEKVQMVTANASLNSISIDAIETDDIVSSDEISDGVAITGTTSLSGAGAVNVTVTDGTTTVTTSGTYSAGLWSASLTTAEVQSLINGQLTITAEALDSGITISDTSFIVLSLPTPTLAISDDASGSVSGPVAFTFTFSEGVTGFTADDVFVANGSKGEFTQISPSEYSLVVTPTTDSSGSIEVSVASNVASGLLTGRGNGDANALQTFNTTAAAAAPSVTIDTSALAADSLPVISGTSSLAPGAPIVIVIDTDNDGIGDLSYASTVQSGGTWSLDLSTAVPAAGAVPEGGFSPSARVTATATNAYGNSASVVGLNLPTVVSQLTSDTTPLVSGSWTQADGDTLSVVVNGVTYSVANGNLTLTPTSWSLAPSEEAALTDGAYEVAATVARASGGSAVDSSSGELVVDATAAVEISGGAASFLVADATPIISGVSSGLPAGAVLTLTIDIGNDSSGDLVYRVLISSDGSWTVDTSSAVPTSGRFPAAGLSGEVLLTASATDPAGNTGVDTQVLTVDVLPPSITLTFNVKTSDETPLIVGMSDLPAGSSITVEIDPNNDGDWSDVQTYFATVGGDGSWSVEATGPMSGSIGVRARGADAVGNETVTPAKTLEIVATAPTIAVGPLASDPGAIYGDGVVDGTEDDSVPVGGSSSNVAVGSVVSISITDGRNSVTDTTIVQADGSWSIEPLNLSSFGNGQITVTASVSDSDGSVYANSYRFNHDKASGGDVLIDYISSDSGTSGDFVTSDNTLRFHGSAAPGETVLLDLAGPSGAFSGVSVLASVSGAWNFDHSSVALLDGNYTLTATVGGVSATQTIIVDSAAPAGPVTVDALATTSLTPTITGTASLGEGEILEVSLNGLTYRMGDGHLTHDGGADTWSLSVPSAHALLPASSDASFSGQYEVSATVFDVARNRLIDSTTDELVVNSATDAAPLITGPSGAAGAASSAATVDESQSAVATLSADESVSWTISGGADSALFEVDAATGALSFKVAPDHESPSDSDGNNQYVVAVEASDGAGNRSTQTITVTVSDLDEAAPLITGPSGAAGDARSAATVDENQSAVAMLSADEAASWSISGEADAALFEVDAATGALSFKAAPDYESPSDSDGNNEYVVAVEATDGAGNRSTQTVTVTVSDLDEAAPLITGPSGAAGAANSAATVDESQSAVATLSADETVSWTISGGADAALFEVDVATGVLSFKTAPDYESPSDSDGNSEYVVAVEATDAAGNKSTQTVAVTVTDLNETAPTVNALTTTDRTPLLSGTAKVFDGERLSVIVNGVSYEPNDGNLTLAEDGWTLQIPEADQLPIGLVEVRVVVERDGVVVLEDVTANELAVVSIIQAQDDAGSAREAGGVANTVPGTAAAGNVLANDLGENVRVARIGLGASVGDGAVALTAGESVTVVGEYGTLLIAADGSYTYRVDDSHALVEALAPGEQLSELFSYEVVDAFGGAATAGLRIAVEGAQDDQVKVAPAVPVVPPRMLPLPPPAILFDPEVPPSQTGDPAPTPIGGSLEDGICGSASSLALPVEMEEAAAGGDFSWSEEARAEQSGFNLRVTVIPDEVPRLMTYKGMPDQHMASSSPIVFTIPTDAFAHTRGDAEVVFRAELADGTQLPDWLSFDTQSGTFSGTPPADLAGELSVKVIARDGNGQQAEALFRIFVTKQSDDSPSARSDLGQRLRSVAYLQL